MPTTSTFEKEKSELNAVLSSGIFNRAPNLARLLTYVCSKYFEGEAAQIKEYNIAVEALGRIPDFDQKRDSIVRVEAHRLRKRLQDYYESEGAGHEVRIEIPSGHYAPRFVLKPEELSPVVDPQPAQVTQSAPLPVPKSIGRPIFLTVATALVLVGILYGSLSYSRGISAVSPPVLTSVAPPRPEDLRDGIHILAGVEDGTTYLDGFGRVWQSDRFFQGGYAAHAAASQSIAGTRDPRLYLNRREGSFAYNIPLDPGLYELRLHFAETLYGESNAAGGGESTRLFSVRVNDKEILHDFDIIADAGAASADVRAFKNISPAPDGKLHLRFDAHNISAILSAIEITPGVGSRARPIRIVAQDHAYTDKAGRYWAADRYARGGQLVVRNEDVTNAADTELYHGERFGNITYVIPAAPGRYRLTLHFSETWFGPGRPGAGGAGSRLFDIMCNGVALKRNFDIYKEAGGSQRVVTYSAHELEPNHQGKLVISLVPVENYACLNALEIVDESK